MLLCHTIQTFAHCMVTLLMLHSIVPELLEVIGSFLLILRAKSKDVVRLLYVHYCVCSHLTAFKHSYA